MVKVTDSWLACHEFEHCTAEDPPCRGTVHVKSIRVQRSSRWYGVVAGRGGFRLRYRLCHLTMVQNYELSDTDTWKANSINGTTFVTAQATNLVEDLRQQVPQSNPKYVLSDSD
ncbi:hypothetical protein TNCV_2161831 [Trichonephila clavipes]|nr:hypothetical protein TNCV_2161831 [Trichonephila clavipes]